MALTALAIASLLATQPFLDGESLHYRVYWAGIRAGEMTLTVRNMDDLIEIRQNTVSTGLVGRIFPMDDTFYSYVEPGGFRSLMFVKDIHEKKRHKTYSTYFLWEEEVSFARGRYAPLPVTAVDTLAAIYKLRASLPVTPIRIIVHDHGKTYVSEVQRIDRELLRIGKRTVPVIRAEPKVVGTVDRDARMVIWFSESPAHVPVKLTFKAALGTLTATIDPYCE